MPPRRTEFAQASGRKQSISSHGFRTTLPAMPILPKHDNCKSEYLQTNDVGEPEEKAKPFAALAQWRKSETQGE